MALPALLLAPIAGFIGSLATKLLDGVITLFTKKFLIHAALIIFFVAIYATFMALLTSIINSIDIASFPSILITGFSMLPTNLDNCLGIVFSTKLAAMAFNVQREILDIRKA